MLPNTDGENVVCQFQQYGDFEATAIKFWYNECSDENPGTFAPIATADQDDYGTFTEPKSTDGTVTRSINEPTGGAYIVSIKLKYNFKWWLSRKYQFESLKIPVKGPVFIDLPLISVLLRLQQRCYTK